MNIAWISKIEWDMPHKTSRYKLSEALRKRGHNVNLYMVKKFKEKIIIPKNNICIPTIHLPFFSGLFYGLIVFFYFPILLKREKFDIIIIDGTKIWIPFIIPLKILNVPLILDIRTLPIDRDELFSFKVSMYLSRYIFNGITTITPELKGILKNTYNLKNIKIGIWSSGVSISDFDYINKKEIIKRNSKNNEFILIYHGDYSPTRGIENLIKSISKLDVDLKNKIKLYIIGMPDTKIKSLLKLCEEKLVKDQVHILPKINYKKIAQYLKIADVGIIPLPPEKKWWKVSSPLKTLEYLAANKPIIATNIPFHQRIFEKGNCGILLESASPEVIAEGITYLYKNKDNVVKMGQEGRKIVENFFTWDHLAGKLEKFLITFISNP
jgi:glycosyltransferase involved in cell wall biosynthesis